MKKNKTVAYLMAAALLVGGTFLGTKAWFVQNEKASNDLRIITGNVDLDVNENLAWRIKNQDGHYTEAIAAASNNKLFTNVKPGDSFVKTITIKNTGSLQQKVVVGDAENILEDLNITGTVEEILNSNTITNELKTALNGVLNNNDVKNTLEKLKINIDVDSIIGDLDIETIINQVVEEFDIENLLKADITFDDKFKENEVLLAVNDEAKFDLSLKISENYGVPVQLKDKIEGKLREILGNRIPEDIVDLIMDTVEVMVLDELENKLSDLFENGLITDGKALEMNKIFKPIRIEATQYNESKIGE